MAKLAKESWNSRLGVILAVSGSAVGLGNFLRFPGEAAKHGGGAFMVAYFISLLIIGLPIAWAEWTMGRYAGQRGFHSGPGVLHAVTRSNWGRYVGVIGIVIPIIIYMFYVYVEAWCLGYALNFLRGEMDFADKEASTGFFTNFIGGDEHGSAFGFGAHEVGFFLIACFIFNFFLIYRGIVKGIEWFCKFAMPALVLLAVVILIRVLTLGAPDPSQPQNNVSNGLGYMWNPTKIVLEERAATEDGAEAAWTPTELLGPSDYKARKAAIEADDGLRVTKTSLGEKLAAPDVWLAAAGQIFFTLSVGFGVIITYSSYMKRDDDVVLSGLSAASANEFCEVALGGLITVPAAFIFLGFTGAAAQGTFDLGFQVLPLVFANMPLGNLFGFLFFFLLFLAAVTSSLSMLQPGIAFLEESLGIGRKQSVALLGLITAVGCGFVVYFSADSIAIATLNFWVGTFLIFVFATLQIIIFGWSLGLDKGLREAEKGAAMRIPRFFRPIIKYLCPLFLLTIFISWVLKNFAGINIFGGDAEVSRQVTNLFGEDPNVAAWLAIGLILALVVAFVLIVSGAERYRHLPDHDEPESEDAQ